MRTSAEVMGRTSFLDTGSRAQVPRPELLGTWAAGSPGLRFRGDEYARLQPRSHLLFMDLLN